MFTEYISDQMPLRWKEFVEDTPKKVITYNHTSP